MAEGDTNDSAHSSKPASAHSGSGLTHRFGPLPVWAWVGVVVVGVIVWKIVRDRQASSASTTTASGTVGAANNANSLFGSEGFSTNSAGEVIDNATGDILGTFGGATGSTGSAGGTGFGAWATNAQQALFNLGFDNGAVDQALQNYSAGQALPQGEYNIIESAIRLVGNPPSGTALPTLQKIAPPAAAAPPPAASSPAPSVAPPLSGALQSLMTSNGEYIVDTAYDNATNSWLYLTQKGGVYGGGYGSIFSLRPGSFTGRTAQSITALGNGGYTIRDTAGEQYTFSPTPGSNYANAGPGNNYTPT